VIALWLTVLLTGAAARAQQPSPIDNDSFERIREALVRPPGLSLDLPKVDFRIHIEERRPLQDVFVQPPWVTPPPEFPPPPGSNREAHDATVAGGSIDPGVVGHAISRAIRTHKARGEVQRAIAAYCVEHRNEPGADAICR
jgi:hypothetical protein